MLIVISSIYFYVEGYQPSAQPPTGEPFVWHLPFDLSSMRGPTSNYATASIALRVLLHTNLLTTISWDTVKKIFILGRETFSVASPRFYSDIISVIILIKLFVSIPNIYISGYTKLFFKLFLLNLFSKEPSMLNT
jgi:hypothetical protein